MPGTVSSVALALEPRRPDPELALSTCSSYLLGKCFKGWRINYISECSLLGALASGTC